MSVFKLSNSNEIVFENFPFPWVTNINFFDPELPGFPLVRTHFLRGRNRYFAIPITYSVKNIDYENATCTMALTVLSNWSEEGGDRDIIYNLFKSEFSERLGLSQALSKEDIKACCNGNQDWETIVDLIFPRLAEYYGSSLPCGQYYTNLYGIIRFAASWNTPAGRKQEMIMTNNLLQTIGTEVDNDIGWGGINFYLLPTYDEVLKNSYRNFPNFQKFHDAVIEYGNRHLTDTYSVNGKDIYILDRRKKVPGGKNAKEKWDTLMDGLTEGTFSLLTQIKEDFNRNYQRPFILITYFYNLFKGVDYREWDYNDYEQIYKDGPRGVYPKVLACILQQAFSKYGCIPIDTWVESFFEEVLNTQSDQIPSSGSNLGKFERFVWHTVQLRKTNQKFFGDILHCIKTGVLHSASIKNRKANPLSCSLCEFNARHCPVYTGIKDKQVIILSEQNISPVEQGGYIRLSKPALDSGDDSDRYFNPRLFDMNAVQNASFIITIKENGTPEGVYFPTNRHHTRWMLTDNMSAFTISSVFEEGIYSVSELISSM